MHLLQDLEKLKGNLWESGKLWPGDCPTNRVIQYSSKDVSKAPFFRDPCAYLPSVKLTLPLFLFKPHSNLSCSQCSLGTREGMYGKISSADLRGNYTKSCHHRDPVGIFCTHTHMDTYMQVCACVCVYTLCSLLILVFVIFFPISYESLQLLPSLSPSILFSRCFSMMKLGLLVLIVFLEKTDCCVITFMYYISKKNSTTNCCKKLPLNHLRQISNPNHNK